MDGRAGAKRRIAVIAFAAVAAVAAGISVIVSVLRPAPLAVSAAAGDLDAVDRDNPAPLVRAIESGDHAAARRLIAAGAGVNVPFHKNDAQKLAFLRRACEGPVSPFPASGLLG